MKVRRTLVAFSAAAALTLTACGNAQDSADGSSNDGSSTSGNASGALTAENFGSSVAEAQADAKSAHLEMTIETMGQEVEATGDFESDPKSKDIKDAKLSMTMAVPQIGDMDVRLVDGVAYINMGTLSQGKFIEIDLNSKDNPLGQSFDDMTKQADPNEMVEQLDGALKEFEQTDETEQIDGVETTKYRMVIDGTKFKDAMGSSSGVPGGQVDMPKNLEAFVWIGDDDLIRKLEMEPKINGSQASFEMEFTKWGDPVEVEVPKKSEITKEMPFGDTSSL